MGLGLRGFTLRYSHEIRPEREYFADIPEMQLPPQMVSLAGEIVDKMLGVSTNPYAVVLQHDCNRFFRDAVWLGDALIGDVSGTMYRLSTSPRDFAVPALIQAPGRRAAGDAKALGGRALWRS
jgi:hypothetical protein